MDDRGETMTRVRSARCLVGKAMRVGTLMMAAGFALFGPAGRAADPQPYSVSIEATGDATLDQALEDSSMLLSLRESAPTGPFGLVARAQADRERFVTALHSFGFYEGRAKVLIAGLELDDPVLLDRLESTPAGTAVRVLVAVERGPQYRLRKIEIDGAVPEEVRAEIDLKPGDPAIAAAVLALRERLLETLQGQAYALAKVEPPVAILHHEIDALDVTFKVDSGPRVELGPIALKGTHHVDESFLRRRLQVSPGDRFDPVAIEQAREDLTALGVFSSVRVHAADEPDPQGNLPIEFDLTDRPQRAVSLGGAYSTDLGGSLSASWRHRNLFGKAEQLSLTGGVANLGGNSTTGIGYTAVLSFVKPDFLVRDQLLQVDLGAIKQSLDAYDRKALTGSALLSRRLSDHWSGSIGMSAEQTEITQQGVRREYTLLGVPITVKYDDTDSLLDPTRGIRAALSVTPTQPLAGAQVDPFVQMQLAGSTYRSLGESDRSVLALRGLVGYVEGVDPADLPPDKRFYAGGSATVRGYKFQSIGPRFPDGSPRGGTAVAAATVEFRQRILDDYGAVLFIDTGQVNADGPPFAGTWGLGVGIGARYYTAFGPIRLDVAIPLKRDPGSGSFELYIGLGQAF